MWHQNLKKQVLGLLRAKTGFPTSERKSGKGGKTSLLRVFIFCLAIGLGLSWLTPQVAKSQQKPKDAEITLVSFAVTKAAYDRIIPKFVEKWKRENNGQFVKVNQSYGGSGSQTRAVIDGLDADVVHLALAFDTSRIQQAGLIKAGWEREVPNNGIVSKSVVALVTREGNPKKINGWSDLARNGISVITANPKTSGVARWNFLALWGSVTKTGKNEQEARKFVTQVYRNVLVLPKDAREASDTFYKQGQGDVLINYENEILLGRQKGEKEPFVIPQVNISIENPVAVVDKNVDKHGTRRVAEAFVKYLYTPEAQQEFAKVGFRPVNTTVAGEFSRNFPSIGKLFTANDLGGWDGIQRKFFADGALFDQIQAELGKR
ncbi:sulfate-binding protein [Oscillatoriales cyanobacterium USR001]|nr:sulfate-binding protein [Oscillatoriales cyanobacterium USR001]